MLWGVGFREGFESQIRWVNERVGSLPDVLRFSIVSSSRPGKGTSGAALLATWAHLPLDDAQVDTGFEEMSGAGMRRV